MVNKKKILSVLEKLQKSQESEFKHFVFYLIKRRSLAIKLLPELENLISDVFRKCVIILMMIIKSKKFKERILSTLGSPVKNKWTIFLGKLSTCQDHNTMIIYLFKTLLQELILREKVFKPFWTPAYKELSEQLLSPIRIGLVDSDTTSLNFWSQKQVEKSKFLEITRQKPLNKNLQTTFCPSSISSVVDKWEKENIKTVQIQIFPTQQQKIDLKTTFDVYRYVKNKTIESIEKCESKINLYDLRNKLVTVDTKCKSFEYTFYKRMIEIFKKEDPVELGWIKYMKKIDMKNVNSSKNDIKDFETKVDKDIRTCAVKDIVTNYKSALSNLKNSNIKKFKMKFKKKTDKFQNITLSPRLVNIKDSKIFINLGKCQNGDSNYYKMSYKNIKKYKNLQINHEVDITFNKNKFFLNIPVKISCKENIPKNQINYCGVDPGSRTFLTTFGNNGTVEYTHNKTLMKKLHKKIDFLKSIRVRKKQINKVEKKLKTMIDIIHWTCINDMLKTNEVIYFGDINSHNIVKNGKNKYLNKDLNDLKFYIFKQRLLFKSKIANKKVVFVHEMFTSQCCSSCGHHYKIEKSEIYDCKNCGMICGRDINAAKNMCMKGILVN